MSNLSEGTRAEIERIAEQGGRGVTGWGLLLAEDEAHGDRRAGRKRPATSGQCPPTPIRRRLSLRMGLGSLVR